MTNLNYASIKLINMTVSKENRFYSLNKILGSKELETNFDIR